MGTGTTTDCIAIPVHVANLPKIKMVSCGGNFTICVDYKGSMWSFGINDEGELGLGNTITQKVPQQIKNLPPVQSISCGNCHTLIITDNENLWSFGRNKFGQLCLENTENQTKPQQTLFSMISNISSGNKYSLFQNRKGKIYGCGYNLFGQFGLGRKKRAIINVTRIYQKILFNFVVDHPIRYFLKEMYLLLVIVE